VGVLQPQRRYHSVRLVGYPLAVHRTETLDPSLKLPELKQWELFRDVATKTRRDEARPAQVHLLSYFLHLAVSSTHELPCNQASEEDSTYLVQVCRPARTLQP
jgi:hypothetical protein